MKILLVGSRGQLGWELLKLNREGRFDCEGLDTPEFDITDRGAVETKLARRKFSLIINAAAFTGVDKAESEPDKAFAVNAEGPRYLALECAKKNTPLIHISTDYVFDGNKRSPYTETDAVDPVCIYGKSKAAGEQSVREELARHIVLRTSWLYSSHGNNFVKAILRLAREREELKVVADQHGCPTYAADLAAAILEIAKQIESRRYVQWGVYHYCGHGVTTWHEFAQKICEIARKRVSMRVKEITAISTSEYSAPAKRPPYSVLDCSKIERVFAIQTRPWEESLADMLAALLTQEGVSKEDLKIEKSEFERLE